VATADPTHGDVPLEVDFDGTGSSDPDGDDLIYQWDLDGDGQYDDGTGSTVTHTYDEEGTYDARLRVTEDRADPLDDVSDVVRITAGNDPPVPVIDAPAGGTSAAVGETVTFAGHATDPQDGTLPDSALSWRLDMHHCPATCHLHPGQEAWSGTDGDSFEVPDHEFPSHLELILKAEDSQGVSATTSVRIDYQTTMLSFDTEPSGLRLSVNGDEDVTPFQRQVAVGATTSLTAPATQQLGGETLGFRSWSDGGARTHQFAAPSGPAAYTATYGGVIEVDTTADQYGKGTGGACSLREAVRTSNLDADFGGCQGGAGADVISVPAGTFVLTRVASGQGGGDLDVTRSVTIGGSGTGDTFVDANGPVTADRVIQVIAPASMALSGITARDGQVTGAGGGIRVAAGAEAHLDDVRVVGNEAGDGAGLYASEATVTLKEGTVAGNTAAEQGGGLYASGSAVTVEGTIVARNEAGDEGGGIYAGGGSLTLDRARLDDNSATADDGGGLFRAGGTTSVTGSVIVANSAADLGGGIHVGGAGATLEVAGSTLTGNQAANGGAVGGGGGTTVLRNSTLSGNVATGNGGGVRSTGGSILLANATVTANTAQTGNGGGLSRLTAGAITVRNTIVAGNDDLTATVRPDCAGAIASEGHNLIGSTEGCAFASSTGDQAGTAGAPIDPLIGALADNGGPTETHALQPGSPATGAGDPGAPGSGGTACEERDQRGVARVDCDVGAYELT
jgi:PKD repeat protein